MNQTYHNLPVSTQTFIVRSNIVSIDLVKCFEDITPKSCIVSVKYKDNVKGNIEPRKPSKISARNFLNCITLTIGAADKKINVKIFNNGTFQMTGCKKRDHVEICMNAILSEFIGKNYLKIQFDHPTEIVYYVISVMRNVDFDVGFKIDRTALGTYVDNNSPYSVPPMTTGYMGVKIKIPIHNIDEIAIPKVEWPSMKVSSVSYKEFFGTLQPDAKKLTKQYFVSLSVFQNGKVLISGVDEAVMQPCYYWFKNLMERGGNDVKVSEKRRKTFIRQFQ
jgi:TATA-box binding protein (TBP) (component of TFIID and TFIIIB)